MEYQADKVLPEFFRKLAESIDKKELKDEELKKCTEFYTGWQYDHCETEHTQDDYRKFLTMGYYVWSHLMGNGAV